MKFYVKAIGPNRYSGGSCNWLLIREIKRENDSLVIKIKTKWGIKYISCSLDMVTPNLIFKNELNGFENFKNICDKFK
jgi:hypothetical protein